MLCTLIIATRLPKHVLLFNIIYKQLVQKLSLGPLYLKRAIPLGRFCSTVNNLVTMVHEQSKPISLSLLLTVNNLVVMVTMEHKQSKPTVEQGSPNNSEHQ
jgi:hypothetical protein